MAWLGVRSRSRSVTNSSLHGFLFVSTYLASVYDASWATLTPGCGLSSPLVKRAKRSAKTGSPSIASTWSWGVLEAGERMASGGPKVAVGLDHRSSVV